MESSKQTHWIPLADLMTGLMMIFMLITAIYISKWYNTLSSGGEIDYFMWACDDDLKIMEKLLS